MCPIGFKDLPLVEQGVDEVRVIVQIVTESGVDDLQDHQQDLLKDSTVS